jgi:glycosyltransferase involved in cell wall biosynthesis
MRIAVLVSNDLVHDQRVRKTCDVMLRKGWEPTLIGRLLPDSKPISRPYETHRISGMPKAGARFYAHLQWELWRFLKRRTDFDAVWANDLDTLWPAWHIAQSRNLPIVYDSHEYFLGAAGLTNRTFPQWVWRQIESRIFPKLTHVITVNEHIAQLYRQQYGVDVKVVRNVPELLPPPEPATRAEFDLPEGKLAILQGAFMDRDRGVLEAVAAMDLLPDVNLLLVGAGEEWEEARRRSSARSAENRIICLPKQEYSRLRQLTRLADVGLSLDKPVHENYQFSLPNKLFDYLHAGVPVVASNVPEVAKVVRAFGVGELTASVTPDAIAAAIRKVIDNGAEHYSVNISEAAEAFNWQKESMTIEAILDSIAGEL